jgi:Na+-driven multidrug efflux pump
MIFPQQLAQLYRSSASGVDADVAAGWSDIVSQVGPALACLGIAAIGDGMHWVFRMVIVGAGDTRWTLMAMVSTAVLTLALPVWALLRLCDPSLLASWNLSPLTASYAIFALYCWLIGLVVFLRFRYGPWQGMSVRR